tara:strand:- start:41094 stop:41552 length:459 start_codon:yes stop_codon:yes gene_type:complete
MITFTSAAQAYNHLHAQIAAATAELAETTQGLTPEAVDAAVADSKALFTKIMAAIEAGKQDELVQLTTVESDNNALGSRISNILDNLKGFNESLALDLMTISEKATHVLVEKGENLISPSGFHPEERVFIRTRTAVAVNRLPRSSNLIAYKL